MGLAPLFTEIEKIKHLVTELRDHMTKATEVVKELVAADMISNDDGSLDRLLENIGYSNIDLDCSLDDFKRLTTNLSAIALRFNIHGKGNDNDS